MQITIPAIPSKGTQHCQIMMVMYLTTLACVTPIVVTQVYINIYCLVKSIQNEGDPGV